MNMQVVWSEGQRVSRFAEWAETMRALVYHYQRVAFGAQYGMPKGAGA